MKPETITGLNFWPADSDATMHYGEHLLNKIDTIIKSVKATELQTYKELFAFTLDRDSQAVLTIARTMTTARGGRFSTTPSYRSQDRYAYEVKVGDEVFESVSAFKKTMATLAGQWVGARQI
jgi:hypothetical protein